jgi:hypothetical protein
MICDLAHLSTSVANPREASNRPTRTTPARSRATAIIVDLRESRLSMFEPLLRGSLAIFIGFGIVCRLVPEHDQRKTI